MAGQIVKGEGFDEHGRFVLSTYRVPGVVYRVFAQMPKMIWREEQVAVLALRTRMQRRGIAPECYFLEASKTDDSTTYRAIAGKPQ